MTVAAVFRVPLQMVLMLLCTPDVIRQRQHFHNDFIPVLPAVNKGSCFFQMSGICAVKPRAILFPTSTPCLFRLYGSMISNRCSISSVTLVPFSSKTTLTHSAYPSYGPSSVFVVPLALPASVVRTPGTVSKMLDAPKAPACNVYRFHTLDFPSFTGTVCIHALYSLRFSLLAANRSIIPTHKKCFRTIAE